MKSSWSEVQSPAAAPERPDSTTSSRPSRASRSTREGILKDIAESRSRLLAAKSPEETIQAANQQTSALGRLLAVVENYPNLKANEQYNRLMDSLEGTENRLAVARKRYNDNVQAYNTSRRQFPGVITNKMFSFKDYPYFEAPPAATAVPKVAFTKK